ncbi:hypothetical protein [Hymenobacter jejuensis]|uniref:Uncharacterized protein n=1 Tax=Hymenobacter jejuensis TaxID=2502781 RepID=A0A5B7ZX07_9BACT|nr:hypothetical protein [Hymenobacter jejuensis]QDA59691.1 hypothetical protein FHG12_06040 [Hymenobacter jejuensis]
MAIVADSAHFLVRPEQQLLEVTWQAPVSSPELRSTYRSVLEQVTQQHIFRLLFDARRRGRASSADELWVANEFMPLLPARLPPGLRPRLAYLVAPVFYESVRAETHNGDMVTESELLTLNHFTDSLSARQWLLSE